MNWLSILGLDGWIARRRSEVIEAALGAEDRWDLARLEWQAYKRSLQVIAMLAVLIAGVTVVALVMLSVALIVQFWDTEHRILVAWLVGASWTAVWVITLVCLMSALRSTSRPFGLTRHELGKDWRALKERL